MLTSLFGGFNAIANRRDFQRELTGMQCFDLLEKLIEYAPYLCARAPVLACV